MDELAKKLDVLFSNRFNFDEDGIAFDTDFDDVDPYDVLVYDNTFVPAGRIQQMLEYGYEVSCLERNEYGWLRGAVSKIVDGEWLMLIFG